MSPSMVTWSFLGMAILVLGFHNHVHRHENHHSPAAGLAYCVHSQRFPPRRLGARDVSHLRRQRHLEKWNELRGDTTVDRRQQQSILVTSPSQVVLSVNGLADGGQVHL
ncbi:hypothetical protein B0O80DRAFT_443367 [Mortierella sp. GBAus27b]|nr:hypothetical protein B0O80DRAFT_443367 [Mortierella sp. GBAus27b]